VARRTKQRQASGMEGEQLGAGIEAAAGVAQASRELVADQLAEVKPYAGLKTINMRWNPWISV
jgi:hypothetical protein